MEKNLDGVGLRDCGAVREDWGWDGVGDIY